MNLSSKLFRIAALLLILSAAFCLSADLIHDLSHDQATAQNDCPDDGRLAPDCFCCCAHVILTTVATAMPTVRFTFIEPPQREFLVFTSPDPLLRPPRA